MNDKEKLEAEKQWAIRDMLYGKPIDKNLPFEEAKKQFGDKIIAFRKSIDPNYDHEEWKKKCSEESK